MEDTPWQLQFGAMPITGGGVKFRVWAPRAERLAVRILGEHACIMPMERGADDLFEAIVPDAQAGVDYLYVIDDRKERPDPVSRWQPQGVHGPSRVVDTRSFAWTDNDWRGLPLSDYLIYELHVGTFTPEGTFEAIIPKIPYLKELGITAIELMPVAEFPGGRNWGYDGVHLYAPQSTYGGPQGLKKLVDACHRADLAVVLDVVYNHLGPEGNYLADYASYFSAKYRTPWGDAINFDGPESDGVRRFFVDNALYWLTEYHVDALRLDAIHRMYDISPRHILAEIGEEFQQQAQHLGRLAWTIAESDLNDVRVIKPQSACGYGLDAQWSDDFHHSLHTLLVKSERGYFADFGRMSDLRQAITEGFVNDGRVSTYRRKRHGTSSAAQPGQQFVVFLQNHDQIANSYWGQRLSTIMTPEQQKLAATVLFCAPNVLLLFMGQEYGETAPFFYFTSHSDPALIEAVRRGRQKEYAEYAFNREYADPQAADTFERSKLCWSRLNQPSHHAILRFYRDLIALRKRYRCLANCDKGQTSVEWDENHHWMLIRRADTDGSRALIACNFSATTQTISTISKEDGWQLAIWSGDSKYGGSQDSASLPLVPNADTGNQLSIELSGWSAIVYLGAKASSY